MLVPGGIAGGCVWDFAGGMRVLRAFWDAALTVAPAAPDEATHLRFGREGEIAGSSRRRASTTSRRARSTSPAHYDDFDDLWAGFTGGVGPSGSFCMSLPEEDRRAGCAPSSTARSARRQGPFTLPARAWYGLGRA